MRLIASGSAHIGNDWREMQTILREGVCDSEKLTIEIDVNAGTDDHKIRHARAKEIHALLTAARDDKSKHSQTTLLHWAALGGHLYAIGELLQDPQCDVLALDSAGKTAFDWAVKEGKNKAAKLLKDFMEKKIKLSLSEQALIATLRFSEENTLRYRGNLVTETPENNFAVIPKPQPVQIFSVKKFVSDAALSVHNTFSPKCASKENDTAVLVRLPVEIANQYRAISRMFGKKREAAETAVSSKSLSQNSLG